MSYYLKILKDHPIGFWQMDDVAINPTFDFNDILDRFDTYQDLLDAYNQYGEINYIATDSSGCGNDGLFVGDFINSQQHFPLSPGGQYSIDITSTKSVEFPIINSYYKQNSPGGFATKYYSDNDFTLECWVSLEISTNNLTTILADPIKNIGIFYQNGNIVFKLDSEYIEYTLPFINKTFHIVCVYSINKAYIYIDGELVVTKTISSNPFTNTEILLQTGPTANSADIFLIDDIAVYRYGLSQFQILEHYADKGYTIPSQIVSPDNGEIFDFYDDALRTMFKYSYPLNKSWEYFLTDDLLYNNSENYIQINKTDSAISKEVIIEDIITLPTGITMDSSKIEWFGDNGITVETSIDGETYEICNNGETIPQYSYDNFSDQRLLYIKITITSEDASKYLPKLYNLYIYFYNQQILYSKNGGGYLSKIDDLNYYLGSESYPILSKDKRNGLLVPANSGFNINMPYDIKSVEFFYTPFSISKSGLFKSDNSEYSWNQNGSINKTNIDSIYVNGVDVTLETAVSDIFTANNLYHVVINFTEASQGIAVFNYKSSGSVKSLYQYMSFYKFALDLNKIIDHYNLYSGKSTYRTTGITLALSENSTNLYNNDWLVIQNS